MSTAWEITSDDIKQVLEPHGIEYTYIISDMVDDGEVEDAVLHYCNFDNQVNASLCNIEDQLIAAGVITGPKLFYGPSEDDADEWEDDEDFEET